MFFGDVCECAIRERICASMHMLMCAIEAGRATTNAVCCRAHECPLWAHTAPEPHSHLMPAGPVWTYEEKRPHFASKHEQKGRHADMTQVSYGRPLRVGKPGP